MSHLRDKLRTKVRRGWCRKNLHRLVGDNVFYGHDHAKRCRACRNAYQAASRDTGRAYKVIRCEQAGCDNATERKVNSTTVYVCRRHRMEQAA